MKYTLTFTLLLFALLYSTQAQTNYTAIIETSREVSYCTYGLTGIYNEVANVILLGETSSQNALVAKYYQVYQNILTVINYFQDGEVPNAMLLMISVWTTVQDLVNDLTIYLPECYSLISPIWLGNQTQ